MRPLYSRLVAFARGVTALAGFRRLTSICTGLAAIKETVLQDTLARRHDAVTP